MLNIPVFKSSKMVPFHFHYVSNLDFDMCTYVLYLSKNLHLKFFNKSGHI